MRSGAAYTLIVLFAINTMNFFDRQIVGALAEPIRREFQLSDSALGGLSTAFTLFYAAAGVPLGRLADRYSRKWILAGGILTWSLLTAVCGATRSYGQLFAVRLGVGFGEATCAPAATSLIGDIFPAGKRARAISIFMLGLPIGIALSYALSGAFAQAYGWRTAFVAAGLPGLLCSVAALLISEPKRGASEPSLVVSDPGSDSPYRRLLSLPTMWWLIASGALHNFMMYALSSFLTPYLMRFHGEDLRTANLLAMAVGLVGVPGLLLGGFAGDRVRAHSLKGRLLVAGIMVFVSTPLFLLALGRPEGAVVPFVVLMGLGYCAMYIYYATAYATIQDVVDPSLRGTAMALYFFAMYVLGASLGPFGTGLASDYFTSRAAEAAGVIQATPMALEPYRASGLRSAMFLIPGLGVLLGLVLFAGSRTVTRDAHRFAG
ncbi:MAG: MFS transporter [Acidobacteria bacterium]|nr:MFS transporter [Acidobacteriota bacterium]